MSRAHQQGDYDSRRFALSRRRLMGGALAVAALGTARGASAQESPAERVAVYPLPNSRTASEGTEISFRGLAPDELDAVTVTGSRSGEVAGQVMPHGDGQGASFVPDQRFQPRETVTVAWERSGGGEATFSFTVAESIPYEVDSTPNQPALPEEVQSFRTHPDFAPPRIEVLANNGGTAPGLIFIAPKRGRGQNGLMILDNDGELVWYRSLGDGPELSLYFRPQTYQGEPVLTVWEGTQASGAHVLGRTRILDTAYREIAVIDVGNGYQSADHHEVAITPRGTALLTIYNSIRWDTSAIGGAPNGAAVDGIVQEIEIATGRVLFEWHCLDHIDLEESYRQANPDRPGSTVDCYHINSVNEAPDDSLVVSVRYTWAIYKLDRATGNVLWRLGGKRSDFAMGAGTTFAFQHDAQLWPNGELSLFDNADPEQPGAYSRGLVLALDNDAMTAEVAHEHIHPDRLLARAQANFQRLENGNALIGWGSEPYCSEFAPDGTLLYDMRFSGNKNSYRAYRAPWTGTPEAPPATASERGSGDQVTISASWNGATGVAAWQVLAGSSEDDLAPIGDPAPRAGFETALTIATDAALIAVEALDADGNVLGRSAAVEAA